MRLKLKKVFDPRTYYSSTNDGFRIIVHCGQAYTILHRTLEETHGLDGAKIIREVAEETFTPIIRSYLFKHIEISTPKLKTEIGCKIYSKFGYGKIVFTELSEERAEVRAPYSFWANSWKTVEGEGREKPVCNFTCGFLAAVMAAVYGRPLGYYKATEIQCIVSGAKECLFIVEEVK